MKNITTILLPLCILGTAQADFVNGGFESPNSGDFAFYSSSEVEGWETTASDDIIEIWSSGFNDVSAYEGDQFAEINATESAALYQDISDIEEGSYLNWEFAHRGRNGDDTVEFSITDLGEDGELGTDDDTELLSKQFTTGNSDWELYTNDDSPITAVSDNTLRFKWESISSTGGSSWGNFLDAATIATSTTAIPEPVTVTLTSCFGLAVISLRRLFM